ncbi:MAG: hypothetical protein IPN83_02755 [Holophagales bacterium]|nr:hypothetical protein [Holophagales bacterium]
MKRTARRLACLLPLSFAVLTTAGGTLAQEPSPAAPAPPAIAGVKAPQPTVPEAFTIEGEFVRVAYNNEGYVTLGYRIANGSVGEEWMYLQTGLTLRHGVKSQSIPREAFSVKTPDGKVIPLATQKDYSNAFGLPALNARARVQRDSLNYFPPGVTSAGAFQFFADMGKVGSLSFDQVEVNDNRAAFGRLFFKIPGGIQTGQHWLVVKFAGSEVQVPFRILTKEEEKQFRKSWEEIKKAFDEAQGLGK